MTALPIRPMRILARLLRNESDNVYGKEYRANSHPSQMVKEPNPTVNCSGRTLFRLLPSAQFGGIQSLSL